jgi:large subunit ribosomal protein L4
MKLDVLNIEGKSTGRSVELPVEIFGMEPNAHAVYLAVKQYNAAQRQGTHKTKVRSEVARSTRKIKKQKGTGTARAGSMKSPVFRGGGRVFGPMPRNYDFKLNKKVKELARFSAFADKAKSNAIVIVEDFNMEAPNTKAYINMLTKLDVTGKSLFVTSDLNKNVYLSSRNLQKAKVATLKDVNTYELINADVLVLSEKSVSQLKSSVE